MSIIFSDLQPVTRSAALMLQHKCPWVLFTSGKREWPAQAHAMAVNVLRNRQWVGEVYPREPQLQAWIDAHPEVTDLQSIADGLYGALLALPDDLQARFAHPAGRAFDLAVPPLEHREETINVIKQLPKLDVFLQHEGGLSIWHVQFHEAYDTIAT